MEYSEYVRKIEAEAQRFSIGTPPGGGTSDAALAGPATFNIGTPDGSRPSSPVPMQEQQPPQAAADFSFTPPPPPGPPPPLGPPSPLPEGVERP